MKLSKCFTISKSKGQFSATLTLTKYGKEIMSNLINIENKVQNNNNEFVNIDKIDIIKSILIADIQMMKQ